MPALAKQPVLVDDDGHGQGILLNAKRKGLIASFSQCVEEMRRHGLRSHPRTVERLKAECGE